MLDELGGEIAVFGYDVRQNEMQVKRLINRVSVEASFFKKLSAMENLRFWGRLHGLSGRTLNARCVDALEFVGLAERAHDKVATVGGDLQIRLDREATRLDDLHLQVE